ncbi:hypothetical protein [Phyllobacterium zundukense]|jgi:hypothetical protein|uniref:Uncharacterized protein n=1 Tax=Phyllobacterium zundukense TaxID=1867719 RepID=A0ACD4D0M6_9HYPH|nr:hypothetical protein [Phyllobacterium zundukense]UXN59405.1 hypothetical protein N8E88_22820 [Phyllobacterium zundukense]
MALIILIAGGFHHLNAKDESLVLAQRGIDKPTGLGPNYEGSQASTE